MRGLRLIADDLTGALDSGCAFASPQRPVLIGLPWRTLPPGPRIAVSTETRNAPQRVAVKTVADMVHRLMPATSPDTLWFKKIDSVMRGHPFAETRAALKASGCHACIFAPAFPEMGRVTTGGRQHVVAPGAATPSPVGPIIVEAFRSQGLGAEIVGFADDCAPRIDGSGPVLVVEAQTQDMLHRRISAMVARFADDTLWAGSGGLAAVLSSTRAGVTHPPIRCVIVGTRHPVTLGQVEQVLAAGIVEEPDENMETALSRPLLVAPSLTTSSAAETERWLHDLLPHVEIAEPQESSIFVTGGDTLSTVLQTVDAEFLECHGQVVTGVPMSKVRGGRWDGATVLSKSGGFGAADLLVGLLR